MKVVENSPQNARNCIIFKNFLGGACPQTPLAKARSFAARDMPQSGMYIQNHKNFKVGPPPLRNPAYAPGNVTISVPMQDRTHHSPHTTTHHQPPPPPNKLFTHSLKPKKNSLTQMDSDS